MLITGAAVLLASDYISWYLIFLGIACLFLLITIGTLVAVKEPDNHQHNVSNSSNRHFMEVLEDYFLIPFMNFITRPQALFILIFIILFKMPDAIAGILVPAFYNEMGYTGTEIGLVSKVYGLIATLIGAYLSAYIITRIKLYNALLISSVLMGCNKSRLPTNFISPKYPIFNTRNLR